MRPRCIRRQYLEIARGTAQIPEYELDTVTVCLPFQYFAVKVIVKKDMRRRVSQRLVVHTRVMLEVQYVTACVGHTRLKEGYRCLKYF